MVEKIIVVYIIDKGLIFQIYKELLQNIQIKQENRQIGKTLEWTVHKGYSTA